MRLWSIHPKYLDCKGLIAVWREGLLARKVLRGKTKGYKRHPQLDRFRLHKQPIKAINAYLSCIYEESLKRCYRFDKRKIGETTRTKISVSSGQVQYEFNYLKTKLKSRDLKKYKELTKVKSVAVNPIFFIKKGPVEAWEKIK